MLPCEDVVPKDADLLVPGVGDSVGGVDLANALLGFIGSVVDIEFGSQGEDNLVTRVASLVDTGAGCTTGNLCFFQAAIAMNPSIVVEIYTSKNGEYSPITMHGIVDPNAQGGTHTTESPVCFRLRTTYTLRDGNELHLLVACGMDVAVNFIIGNSWFKQIGAVIHYGSNCQKTSLSTREGIVVESKFREEYSSLMNSRRH